MVAASAANLWRRPAELFVVTDVNLKQMKLGGTLQGRRRTFRVAVGGALVGPARVHLALAEGAAQ